MDKLFEENIETYQNTAISDKNPTTTINSGDNLDKATEKSAKKSFAFIKFFLLTVPAGLMQLLSIYLFEILLNQQHWLAYIIGFACATAWNFTINRKKTFGTSISAQKAVPRILLFYISFAGGSTLLNWLWQFIPWGEYVYFGSYLATILTMAANCILTFFVCKHIAHVCAKPEKVENLPIIEEELTSGLPD